MNIHTLKREEEKKARELILAILDAEYAIDQEAYPPKDLQHLARAYGAKREIFYVASDHGKIIGTVGIKEDSDTNALLRRLFVDPHYRGSGLGSRLVDKACGFCERHGYRRVTFRSTSNMVPAIKLCIKKGFQESERMKLGPLEVVRLDKII